MRRIVGLDAIRAVAILLIVACHICYGVNAMSPVGQYLGGTYNFVFFLLSAILLGLTRQHIGEEKVWIFFKKRIARLVPDLWLFLIVYIVICACLGISFLIKTVVMNFLLLGWFYKLPGCGHLWFVTMIFSCYALFYFLSKRLSYNNIMALCLLVLCVIGQIILEWCGLPGYYFLILLMCGLGFLYASPIIQFIKAVKIWWILIAFCVIKLGFYYALQYGYLQIGNLSYYYVAVLSAILSFIVLFRLFEKIHVGRFFQFISVYSYQIYLVHHPLCNVDFFSSYIPNLWVIILIIYMVSFLLAYCLKHLSAFIVASVKI
mgnify:FL=1